MPAEVSFRVVDHQERPGVKVVEILQDGKCCAVLYPQPDGSVRLVSAHFAGQLAKEKEFPEGVTMNNGTYGLSNPIPAIEVRFDPRPYTITPCAGLVRLPKQ